MPDSLFITGATGYIGSRVLSSLDRRNYRRIICLSRAKPAAAQAGVEYVLADLLDSGAYSGALSQCDTVLHMAAVTGKSRPAEYFRVNREGTRTLAGESLRAGVKRFVYVSSIAAKFRDQSRYYYAQSKRQAEEVVASSGLAHTIVRPTMVMGKGAPVLEGLARLASAPVLPIFGNGRARVQPVSVNDLTTCLLDILKGGFEGGTLEIGGPQILSMEELLVKIRRAGERQTGLCSIYPRGCWPPEWGSLKR